MENNASTDTLADNLKEVKAGKISETLTHSKATLQFVTLSPTLAEIKAQTADKTLSDVVPQILVDTRSVTVAEVLGKTSKNTPTYVKPFQKVLDTPAAVDA